MSVLTWTQEQRSRISQAIAAEIERARVSHKFIDTQKVSESSRTVPANQFDAANGTVDDGVQLPVVELLVEFDLTKLQAEDPHLDSALTIVRRAAIELARGHDSVVFTGDVPIGCRCKARGLPNEDVPGLIGAAKGKALNVKKDKTSYADSMITEVSAARARLDAAGFSGGYVMVMGTTFFAEAHKSIPGSPERPIKVIEGLIEGAVHSSNVIPADEALLISATADATDRAVASEPAVDYGSVTIGANEVRKCRVFERFTPRIKDPRCAVRLQLA